MTALGRNGYNCILRPSCWMDSNPFDYAFLLLHSPTYNHVDASQGLKRGTSALLQKSPTRAITVYH